MKRNYGFQLKIIVIGLCIVLMATSYAGSTKEHNGKTIDDSTHQILIPSMEEDRVEKSTGENTPVVSEEGYVPNEILIKFRSGSVPPSSSKEMIGLLNQKTKGKLSFAPIVSMNPVFSDTGETRVGLERWFQLKVAVDTGDVRDEIRKYQDPVFQDVFEYVQPSYIYRASLVPNDPFYSSSGGWGQDYPDLWGMHQINAAGAWDFTTGSNAVVVAVVDTGVDYNHPDLAANIWVDGAGHHGTDLYNGDSDPMDDNGHGTHCAGTIAAVGNNAVGVVGVNWQCKIMAVKCLSSSGSGDSYTCANGIQWAASHGADVISNSWGPAGRNPSDQAAEDAVRYAYYNKGCVVVFAAGNSNDDVQYYSPANVDEVIAVASTDHDDKKSDFSNGGEKIDVSAPGGDSQSVGTIGRNILSLRAAGTDIYLGAVGYKPGECFVPAFDPNAKYYRARGTSMACPHVAGLAALLLSEYPDYSNAEIAERIRYTANNIDDLNPGYEGLLGSGRINAFRAIKDYNHDVGILFVQKHPDHIRTHTMLSIHATVINDGKYDETNVAVILRSNEIPVDSLTIPMFPHKSLQDITLSWTPSIAGAYNLSLNITILGVPDDYPLDNEYSKTILVGVLNIDTGELFNTIQESLNDNDTMGGHHILVPKGLYQENLLITKNIYLKGMEKTTTIIDGCSADVVLMQGTSFVNISEFTITNGTYGVIVTDASHTIIRDTIIENNANTGVILSSATDTTLLHNDIIGNSVGVEIAPTSSNAYIYNNNFNNTQNAVDAGTGNRWDSGYPFGGNYWSDYQGCDENNGPDQNITGPDGIGDIPYIISDDRNSQDCYPLKYPFEVLVVNLHTEKIFSGIQHAIDDSNTTDYQRILVKSHSYHERIVVNKRITLWGQDKHTTIIDGGGISSAMTVSSDEVTITGFTIQNNKKTGIYVSSSENDVIYGNIFTTNAYGVIFSSSTKVTVTGNIFSDSGISIASPYGFLGYWNTHTISENTVNGKPIRYYKNMDGVVVPSDTGQVILANCMNMVIQNLDISDVDNGIQVGFSSHNTIVDNSIANKISSMGINLCYSSNNTIIRNRIINGSGISLYNSVYNTITKNNLNGIQKNNSLDGIYLSYSYHNTISRNTITNSYGIDLFASSYNNIANNFCYGNIYGISLYQDSYVPKCRQGASENNVISGNTVANNDIGVDFDNGNGNKNNLFYHNNFICNAAQAFNYGDNIWCNETTWQGNYWSDYIDLYPAIDDNFDGIWDYYYEVSGDPIGYDWGPLVYPYIPGDMNHDQVVNFDDINPFNLSLADPWEYQIEYQMLPSLHGDLNGDGEANAGDVGLFVELMNEMVSDRPDTPLAPEGSLCGIVGNEYIYSASTVDPAGDYIQYGWGLDGDNVVDSWTSFVPSGTVTSIPCYWYERGTYEVKVKAKDPWCFESDWSVPLQVRIVILGDMNDDGVIDFGDINPFVLALTNPAEYSNRFPGLDLNVVGDINQDGVCDFGDINPFIQLLIGG